jgi:hypothetical protein
MARKNRERLATQEEGGLEGFRRRTLGECSSNCRSLGKEADDSR